MIIHGVVYEALHSVTQYDTTRSKSQLYLTLGYVIPPFLTQIISASMFFLEPQQDPTKSKKVDFQVSLIPLLLVI